MRQKFNKGVSFRRQNSQIESSRHQKKLYEADDSLGPSQQAKLDFLQTINLFAQLSQQRLKHKLHIFKEESHLRGAIFFKENDPVDYCWLIISGEVQLSCLVAVETLRDKQRVQLAVCIPKTIFGEGEFITDHQKRLFRAQCITEVQCYKIAMAEFSQLMIVSNLFDQLHNEFMLKKKNWQNHMNHDFGYSGSKAVTLEVDRLHVEYKNQVEIPKTYGNFVPANKMIWNQKETNIDKELQQAQVDKQAEVQNLMNYQVKKQFKRNYIMRRLLIEGHRQKIHIEVMDGLNLSKYVNPGGFQMNRLDKVFAKLRHYQTQQEFQGPYQQEEEKFKDCTFENAKLKDLRPFSKQFSQATANTYNGYQTPEQFFNSQKPLRLFSASSTFLKSPPTELIKFASESPSKTIDHLEEQLFSITKTRPNTVTARKTVTRPTTAATTTTIQFMPPMDHKISQNRFVKPRGKPSQKFFKDLFKR